MINTNFSPYVTVHNIPQRSAEWYVLHIGRWTGSSIIHLLKGKKDPPEMGDYDNYHMVRGRVLEDLAIEGWELSEQGITGVVERYGFITNSRFPNAGCSPDGVWGHILLEVKCFQLEKHNEIIKTGIIPEEVLAQIHLSFIVTGLNVAHLVLYNPDSVTPLHIIEVKKKPKIVKNIREKLRDNGSRSKS